MPYLGETDLTHLMLLEFWIWELNANSLVENRISINKINNLLLVGTEI